jgi:hypothetical protein
MYQPGIRFSFPSGLNVQLFAMLFASLSQRLDCINDRYEPNLISAASGLANEDFCGSGCNKRAH